MDPFGDELTERGFRADDLTDSGVRLCDRSHSATEDLTDTAGPGIDSEVDEFTVSVAERNDALSDSRLRNHRPKRTLFSDESSEETSCTCPSDSTRIGAATSLEVCAPEETD